MQKTTIGDIAREVGIGVGSVYLEFDSKDQIVAELAGSRQRLIAERMQVASRRGPPLRRLEAALEARVQALFDLAADGAHACDLVTCGESSTDSRKLAPTGFSTEEHDVLVRLIEEALGARRGATDSAETWAATIERAYATLSPPWVFCQSRENALRSARELNRLMLFGVEGAADAPPRRSALGRRSGSR